jgi:hypothetical protein
MIAFIIGAFFLVMLAAVPFSFFAFRRIGKAKTEAKALLANGKIDDIKAAEVTLKLLSVMKDQESEHLWKELNALCEKYRKAS